MIYVLLMYAFLALTIILSKDLLLSVDPLLMVVIRMGMSGFIFSIYAFFNTVYQRISFSYFWAIIILAIGNVYAANVLQIFGLHYIDAVHASLWYNSTPFIIASLNYLIYRTRLTFKKIIALFLGWLGFLPLIIQQPMQIMPFYLHGVLFFLLSAIVMGISGLLLEKNNSLRSHPVSVTNALSMLIGAFFAFCHYTFFYTSITSPLLLTVNSFILLVILAISTVICAGLYVIFVRKHGALLVTFMGFTLPIFSAIFEIVLGRSIDVTWYTLISTLMITIALYLFTSKKMKQAIVE